MKPSPPTTLSDVQLTGLRGQVPAPQGPHRSRLMIELKRRRPFLIAVVLPLIMVGIALFGVVSDQYVVESRFAILSRQGGSGSGSQSESKTSGSDGAAAALAVRDYLMSLDGLRTLRKTTDVVSMWRVPEADWIMELKDPDAPAESILKYFNWMVTVSLDATSGLAVLRVQSFRAKDALDINEHLLQMAEALVNQLSLRSREDQLSLARNEVKLAEQRVSKAQEALIEFQRKEQAVDPSASAGIGQASIARLEGNLSDTRATLQEQLGYMRPDNPQVINSRNRITALQKQIEQERLQLTQRQSQLAQQGPYHGNDSLPEQMAFYERLQMEKTFADTQLASATTSLETARVEASRQQLYLARVVQPVLAQAALEPRRMFIFISAALVLVVLYGLGWLIVAGIREHGN